MVSGVAPMAANYVWQTTAEGDWIILMLQTAGFLLQTITQAVQGKPLSDGLAYLAPLRGNEDLVAVVMAIPVPLANSEQDFKSDLEFLARLFRHCALVTVATAGQHFREQMQETGGKYNEAMNNCAVELVNAVRVHCLSFMLANFLNAVNSCEDTKIRCVLSQLCALYACSTILDDPLWGGFVSFSQLQLVRLAGLQLMAAIRPNAVALVDAFDFHDKVLNSAIGSSDGNIYEALYEAAQKAPLNQTDPFDGYHEFLRPHLDLEFLKKGNKL